MPSRYRRNTLLAPLLVSSLALNGYLLFDQIQQAVNEDQFVDHGERFSAHVEMEQNLLVNGEVKPTPHRGEDAPITPNDLELLFEAKDYQATLEGYRWLLAHDAKAANVLMEAWSTRIRLQLPELSDRQDIDRFTALAVNRFPRLVEPALLRADFLVASKRYTAAIALLYERIHTSRVPMQGVYIRHLEQLVSAYVKQLEEQYAWASLVDLAERLLWHEPHHPPYGILAAKAHVASGHYDAAKNTLYPIEHDVAYGNKVKALLEEIALLELRETAIPLISNGAHFLVDGRLNNQRGIRLMIDTGASLSVIDEHALEALKLSVAPEFIRVATINTAGGKIKASIYRFASYQIGDFRVSNIEFVVMPRIKGKNNNVGLLGMNFLSRFRFEIDQKNKLLMLSPQK